MHNNGMRNIAIIAQVDHGKTNLVDFMFVFFFFKQKTAYEMAQCDWIQTCALPISARLRQGRRARAGAREGEEAPPRGARPHPPARRAGQAGPRAQVREEEDRVPPGE